MFTSRTSIAEPGTLEPKPDRDPLIPAGPRMTRGILPEFFGVGGRETAGAAAPLEHHRDLQTIRPPQPLSPVRQVEGDPGPPPGIHPSSLDRGVGLGSFESGRHAVSSSRKPPDRDNRPASRPRTAPRAGWVAARSSCKLDRGGQHLSPFPRRRARPRRNETGLLHRGSRASKLHQVVLDHVPGPRPMPFVVPGPAAPRRYPRPMVICTVVHVAAGSRSGSRTRRGWRSAGPGCSGPSPCPG